MTTAARCPSLAPLPTLLTLPLTLILAVPAAFAAGPAPTVGELINACERSRAAGGAGVDAALCEWYAVPCDCQFKRADAPAICVPPGTAIEASARRVLAELRQEADRNAPAPPAVARAMARLYPCPVTNP